MELPSQKKPIHFLLYRKNRPNCSTYLKFIFAFYGAHLFDPSENYNSSPWANVQLQEIYSILKKHLIQSEVGNQQ